MSTVSTLGGGSESPLLIGHECFRVVTCVQGVVIADGDAYGNPARAGEGPGGRFGGKAGNLRGGRGRLGGFVGCRCLTVGVGQVVEEPA
jgi:hypothetical protein